MARLPYATREDTPQAHQAAYDRMINERGGGNIFLALANIPNLTNALLDFHQGNESWCCRRTAAARAQHLDSRTR
jgi:hypothetical protein